MKNNYGGTGNWTLEPKNFHSAGKSANHYTSQTVVVPLSKTINYVWNAKKEEIQIVAI